MLDAIIISDSGNETFSASSPLRLKLDGRIALIQNVRNYIENDCRIVPPVAGDRLANWHGAYKCNGLMLYSRLTESGHRVALIDSYFQQRDRFIELLSESPRAIIVSTTFVFPKSALCELTADIRSLAPDAFVIAGGPFVFSSYMLLHRRGQNGYDTVSPEPDYLFLTTRNRPEVDLYIIDRDGLTLLDEALARLKSGRGLDDLPNTARFDGDRYAFAARRELPADPCRRGIDWRHAPNQALFSGVASVQASVGCPFSCEFCNFVKSRRHTCIRPLDHVISELKALCDRQVRYVRFVDDNFRLGKTDLDDVCRRIAAESLPLKWMSFISANALESADVRLLKKAGCIEVQMGLESADASILQRMNKHADPDLYRRVVTRLLEAGINCSCCFIVGFPGETQDSFQKTVDFINTISNAAQEGIFSWSIYPFLLAPLSPIYAPKRRAKYGLTGYMDQWRHATMDSEQAKNLIIEAFLAIDHAGPIYSEDNLDLLFSLRPELRKRFMVSRHRLAKKRLAGSLDPEQVIAEFSPVTELFSTKSEP